jgi:hypothetical protein
MIENVPGYVSILFILTTFLTVGFLFYAIKQTVFDTFAAKIVITAAAFWLIFTAMLALGGFYLSVDGFPPRFAFAPMPALLLIVILFIFFRRDFIDKLPLKILTLLQIVRIPVEIGLYWLFQNGMIPQIMTFEGRNFDILAGITAPFVFWLAFRQGKPNRPVLIAWNLVCLALVMNIVLTAIFSLPTSFQQFGLEQPNRAVLYFPYIWLPAIIVPIVLFAHLASLRQLLKRP